MKNQHKSKPCSNIKVNISILQLLDNLIIILVEIKIFMNIYKVNKFNLRTNYLQNNLKTYVSLLACILLVVFFFSTPPSKAEEQNKANLLTVNGSAKLPVNPDVAEVVVGIEADSKTASDAQSRVSAVLTSFIAQLKSIGIQSQEIKTIESNLSPVRDYSNNKPPYKITSYTAIQKIRVRVVGESRLNLISRVIDAATQNSINRIESINFSVSPDLAKEVNRKIMAMAAEDALKAGKEVLEKLNLNMVAIKNISLNSYNNYPVYNSMAPMARGGFADAAMEKAIPEITSIMPGELMMDGSVSMTLEFK
jgi:hypothetical protein